VEVKDVRVVGKSKNILVGAGLVTSGGADVHNLAGTEVGELQLEGKDVPSLGTVSNLKFVSVFVHFVDREDLGNAVKIALLLLGGRELSVLVGGDTVVAAQVSTNPLAEGLKEGNFVLLEGGALSAVGGRGEGGVLSGEESPGALPLGGNVELTLVLVHAEGSAMETDDVADAGGNWEVFETLSIDDNSGKVVISGLSALVVERRVNNLEGANVSLRVDLVGESSVNNNTVDVVVLVGGEGNLVEFGVLVTLSLGSNLGGNGFLNGFGSGHL